MQKISKKISSITNKRSTKKLKPVFFDDDIFLVSYPKSGNTWLRFMIANYLSNNQCSFTNSHLIIPDIHYNPGDCASIPQPRFIKSHFPITSDYKRVIYLVRDGRDVAVSYYFHLKKFGQINQETKFNDFIDRFNTNSIDSFSLWSDHVHSSLDRAPNNFLLVRYEKLKSNTFDQLIQILEFAGISPQQDRVATAIEAANFENMKNLERSQYDLFKPLANSDKGIPFVRSGQVGEWQHFFNDELLEEFTQIHGSALKRLGYV